MEAKKDSSAIAVEQKKNGSEAQAYARISISPSLQSALTYESAPKAGQMYMFIDMPTGNPPSDARATVS